MADETRSDKSVTLLPWLFPVTYLIHIAEEYWGGGGYSRYMKLYGVELPPWRFLVLNSIGLALMVLGVVLARRYRFSQWLIVCLGALVIGNGLSHTITAARRHEYNPGLVSGLLIWIPLGLAMLFYVKRRMAARRYWIALAVGIGIQVVVALLALRGGKL